MTAKDFVVLQSIPPPRPTTNPYVVLLARSLSAQPGVELRHFSWRLALTSRFDVLHVHWPEALLAGRTPLRRLAHQGLYLLLLGKLALTRAPLVRTVHNVELPQGISRRERLLLQLTERMTTLRIRINSSTVLPPGQPYETIPHGHYRDWFTRVPHAAPTRGRVLFFGLIRRYKGVDTLVTAFRETATQPEPLTLRVAGSPSNEALAQEITQLAGDDERVSLHFSFLDDEQLVHEVTQSELVVLPAREMHNSGGVLAALSLGRPVLVVDNATNGELGHEVGAGWVLRYTGTLHGEDILDALAAVRAPGRSAQPDLGQRGWDTAGRDHLAAYRRAVSAKRAPAPASSARAQP